LEHLNGGSAVFAIVPDVDMLGMDAQAFRERQLVEPALINGIPRCLVIVDDEYGVARAPMGHLPHVIPLPRPERWRHGQ
jgi:hypothetical protein